MKTSLLIIRMAVAIIIVAIAFISQSPTFANQQSKGGFVSLVPSKVEYIPTVREVRIDVTIENTDIVIRDYQVSIAFFEPSGELVFEVFSTDQDDIGKITIDPGDTKLVPFRWEGINSRSESGLYTVTAILRDWNDFEDVIDVVTPEDEVTFSIKAKPFINLTREEIDFGSFKPGETPQESFVVTNSGNGLLEWEITRWPENWIEIITPLTVFQNKQTIELRVRRDALISQPLRGRIRIESNAGEAEIELTGSISGSVRGRLDHISPVLSTRKQGDEMLIEFEVENDGTVGLEYRAGVVIQAPDETIVFDGLASGNEITFGLGPDEDILQRYTWQIPVDAQIGDYLVTLSLRYLHDPNLIFHDYFDVNFIPDARQPFVSGTFTIIEGPLLSLSAAEIDFGTLPPGQGSEKNISVSNARGATLQWQVTSSPSWAELIEPTDVVTNTGNIVVAVPSSLQPGEYIGTIEIDSNGGNLSVLVSANVQAAATATPTAAPTATSVPATATPRPTATSAPTSTPVPPTTTPEPTATSVPATATPQPTATSEPTSTPVPPTSTPAPTATTAPVVVQAATEVPEEPPSSGGCGSAASHVSKSTALANISFLIAPLGLIGAVRYGRRSKTRRKA